MWRVPLKMLLWRALFDISIMYVHMNLNIHDRYERVKGHTRSFISRWMGVSSPFLTWPLLPARSLL